MKSRRNIFHYNKHFTAALTLTSLLALGPAINSGLSGRAMASPTPASISSSAKKKTSKGSTAAKKKSRKKTQSKTKRATTISKNRKSVSSRWTNPTPAAAEQVSNDSLTLSVNRSLLSLIPPEMNPGGLRVNRVTPNSSRRQTEISLNDNFTYLPVTPDLISELQREVKASLPDSLKDFRVQLKVGSHDLSYYITKVHPLPENQRKNPPFVVYAEPWVNPRKGMEGDILAIWHSHGRYYKPSAGGWMWQRPFLFQSVEDTYTMGYVLPFLVPMLENAGAYVMLPRERDTNSEEIIVDNDINPEGGLYSQSTYKEQNTFRQWETGEEEGFIYDLPDFRDTENPFENGTYRQTTTIRNGKPSVAAWYADIPKDGEYAVYVSYKTLPNSTTDAHYTINYSGGSREFRVNQTMGGSTWIYLGTFPLEKGFSDSEPIVTLTNFSETAADKIVTADAVKIGGGMGNIARSPRRSDVTNDPSTPLDDEVAEDADDEDSEDEETSETTTTATEPTSTPIQTQAKAASFKTSGLPRYLEGSRYWLHWAGFPEEVYSPYHGTDDYKDDYTSRALWVNYLAGGSRVLPDDQGLGIPVDLTMALHSDAGKRADDSFVGTLGIYYTNGGDSYTDGTPRINSRMLTDMIMRQIVADVRREWEPDWTRRSMWDKSYVEARIPEVPTALIELLSHQNFADMQYGLDPAFRFTVSRAIYKAIGRFMAERKERQFIVQPLPVSNFAIKRVGRAKYRLQWGATTDSLEPSAKPEKYIILERSGDELGFHKIGETHSTHFDVKTEDNETHSFRIIAANEGGISFPSETLSFRESADGSAPVLIVNGFTRISGPESFSEEDRAGFDSSADFGVPYIKDLSYTGPQTEFRRSAGESFGRSSSVDVAKIVAGNTFDYPALHGEAIGSTGRGFVSASLGAVERGEVKLSDFKIVDLILGRQQATVTGRGKDGARFHTFPEFLRRELTAYLSHGGRLLVSGENIATDPTGPFGDRRSSEWLETTLGVTPDSMAISKSGRVETTPQGVSAGFGERTYQYSNTLNEHMYALQHPDALAPAPGFDSKSLLTFTDTDGSAALLLKKGKQRQAVMSIPIETITDVNQRNLLIKELLDWLDK